MSVIYMIKNLRNGKFYIGSSADIDQGTTSRAGYKIELL